MSGGRAKFLLMDRLEHECAALFALRSLPDAVLSTFHVGEVSIAEQVVALFRKHECLALDSMSGLLRRPDGTHYSIYVGADALSPSTMVVRATPHLHGEQLITRQRELGVSGRYGSVVALVPESMVMTAELAMDEITDLLDSLHGWVQHKIFAAVELFAANIADGVYSVLTQFAQIDFARRHLDIAVIGRDAGWRLPQLSSAERTLTRLRRSNAKHRPGEGWHSFVERSG